MLDRPTPRTRGLAALQAGGLVLVGEAGIGKTVLAGEIAREYADADVTELPIRPAAGVTRLASGTMARHMGDVELTGGPAAVGEKTLLRIDDADLLDDVSSRYVSWLVRTAKATLIATTRNFQLLPATLQMLVKDEGFEQMTVPAFDRSETTRLLDAALGGPVHETVSTQIWRRSGGNALFIRELVHAGLESATLEKSESGWDACDSIAAGDRLKDLLHDRLDALPPTVRTIVELVALGDPLPRSSLFNLVDSADYDRALAADLVKLETIRPSGQVRVRPAHPVIGDVVRAIVPAATKLELYRRANEFRSRPAIADTPTARLRAATWAHECGIDPGFEVLQSAAFAAVQLHDVEACRTMVAAALNAKDISDVGRVRALAVKAFALDFAGEHEASRVVADEGWRLVAEPGVFDELCLTGRRRSAVALVRMRAGHAQKIDDDPVLVADIARSGAWVTDSDEEARLLELGLRGWAGDWQAFLPRAEALLDEHGVRTGGRLPSAVFPLIAAYTYALVARGETARARQLCRRALAAARANSDTEPWAVGQLRAAQHRAYLAAGDIDVAAQMLAAEAEADLPFMRFESDINIIGNAEIAMARGRWSDAAGQLQRVTELLARVDRSGISAYAWARRAYAEAVSGAASAAASLARAQREPLRGARMEEGEVRLTLLCAAVVLGDYRTGEADGLISWARGHGFNTVELDALHVKYLQNPFDRSEVADRIAAIAPAVDGVRGRLVAEHVAAAEASDASREQRIKRRLGARGIWVHARMPRTQLTPREHEIAALAASGLQNKSIAERLQISVRTVDSHLSSVFSKLEITGRGELDRLYMG